MTRPLTVGEALARAADYRDRWVRLGKSLKTGVWTFMCPKCGCWFTLVTRPKMPETCPRCGKPVKPPLPEEGMTDA